ncbi:MFS transporter [Nocardia brevicatena]|uniref:MFS transporter n=1 Tax=Nocardia brevicatena TaxID=37327 RepID=UPI003F687C14
MTTAAQASVGLRSERGPILGSVMLATALVAVDSTVIGAVGTLFIGTGSTVRQIAATRFLIGLGLGLISTPTLIAAQTSADWTERGVVTSANMFARSLGSAVGVAVFGALVNSRVGDADPLPPSCRPKVCIRCSSRWRRPWCSPPRSCPAVPRGRPEHGGDRGSDGSLPRPPGRRGRSRGLLFPLSRTGYLACVRPCRQRADTN